jgi:hypothetical protein
MNARDTISMRRRPGLNVNNPHTRINLSMSIEGRRNTVTVINVTTMNTMKNIMDTVMATNGTPLVLMLLVTE